MNAFEVNSFQVPNALIDNLMAELTGNELKCYLVIVRKTKGWQKNEDAISISQFVELTKLSNRVVIQCCKSLEEKGLIESRTGHRNTNVYMCKKVTCDEKSLVTNSHSSCDEKSQVTCDESSHTKNNNKYTTKKTNIKNNKKDSADSQILEIFEFWKAEFNHPKAKLDPPRSKRIKSVLERYSVDDIKKALLGAKLDPWLMGENRQNTVYDGIVSILKDSDKIERLIQLHSNPHAKAISGNQYSATTAKNMQTAQDWLNSRAEGPF